MWQRGGNNPDMTPQDARNLKDWSLSYLIHNSFLYLSSLQATTRRETTAKGGKGIQTSASRKGHVQHHQQQW